jgi:hypothetical protein
MGRKSILSREEYDESRYVSDLARKQPIEQLVLRQKNGIFPLGQISRESIPAAILPQEDQFRSGAHFVWYASPQS